MFDGLKRLLQNIARTLFPSKRKSVSPDEIIEQALEAAKLHAQDWGAESKQELPNLFDVTINGWDWSEYYSRRTGEIANRMAVTLLERMDSEKYVMEGTPVFKLYRSSNPDFDGVEVRVSFAGAEGARGGSPSRVRLASVGASTAKTERFPNKGLSDAETVKLPGGDTLKAGESLASVVDEDANKTVVAEKGAATAYLEQGSLRLRVADGYRVGAARDGASNPVEILLPSAGHEKTSREHGVFSLSGSQWSYMNLGVNGTKVEHLDGSTERLTKGESCLLRDADVLFFGTSTGYRFSAPDGWQDLSGTLS